MNEINKLIQIYGYNHEIKLFQSISLSYNSFAKEHSEENYKAFIKDMESFFSYSFNTYRKEMVLDKL